MHVLSFGSGAIGSQVAARLSLAAVDVTLVARRDHVAAIRTRGLTLETPRARAVCPRVDSITAIEDVTIPPDIVLLTVKAYDTKEAMRTLQGALGATTPVLSLQNGVGNEELIAAEIGAHRTFAGTITISASRPRPGVVRQNTAVGGIGAAALDPGQDPSGWVQLFRRAGIPAKSYRKFREMKWSKLLINLFTNATSAIVDLSPVAVVEDPRLLQIERTALREALAVMKELELRPVALPGYPVPALRAALVAPVWLVRPVLRRLVRRGRGETRTSLWHDLQRDRSENEVAVLNGAVAREAARLGVRAPVNAALTEVLTGLAAGRLDPAEFRGRPEALLARVTAKTDVRP
jgi:2-dehydropantoate 2-reductase